MYYEARTLNMTHKTNKRHHKIPTVKGKMCTEREKTSLPAAKLASSGTTLTEVITGASTSGTHIFWPPNQLPPPLLQTLNKESPFGMTSVSASRWFDNFPAGPSAQDLHNCRTTLYTEVCCPRQASRIASVCFYRIPDWKMKDNIIILGFWAF